MRARPCRILALVASLAAVAPVQGQNAPPPAFDAVSIKPNRSGEQGGSSRAQPGRYVGVSWPIGCLVRLAYRPIEEFDGGPEWKDRDRFDLEAVTGATVAPPQMLVMLRTMLADRFKLRVHTETRPLPVYELSLVRPDGRLGPGLTRVAASCPPPDPVAPPVPADAAAPPPVRCGFTLQNGVLKGAGTMASIASELVVAGRRAVDRTGLAGVYSIDLKWTPDAAAGQPADAPPEIFTGIREQLGLQVKAATVPTEVLVIDAAERPDAN